MLGLFHSYELGLNCLTDVSVHHTFFGCFVGISHVWILRQWSDMFELMDCSLFLDILATHRDVDQLSFQCTDV